MKKVAIATLGCKTNQFESAAISEKFAAAGYVIVPFSEAADIYVVNSCTVTSKTDAETRRLIRRASRLNPDARIVATGCYAQVAPEELDKMTEVSVVLGNLEKLDTALLTDSQVSLVTDSHNDQQFPPLRLSSFNEHTRAFLQIQNGCNSFCAYCIVPYARGRSRSVTPDDAVKGIKRLTENGFKEVVLTGIHLGAYGLDLNPAINLEQLIRRILNETSIERLRIGSVEPNEFSDELIALCTDTPRICRHFHIPLQSGCDSVLSSMGRHYTTEQYSNLLHKLISAMPDAFIGADIIAGFPGETEEEFEATVAFVQSLPLADMHVFPYSRRPMTRAAAMPEHLSPETIINRAARLRAIAAEKKKQFMGRQYGQELLVLGQQYANAKGTVKGISRNYITVQFNGTAEDINQEHRVLINRIKDGVAIGAKNGISQP